MQLGGGIGIGLEFKGKKILGLLGSVFSSESLVSWASRMKGVFLALESVVGTKGMSVCGIRRCQCACSPLCNVTTTVCLT